MGSLFVRGLVAQICAGLVGVAVSFLLHRPFGVRPGRYIVAIDWAGPVESWVLATQFVLTAWAIKRAVEIHTPGPARKLSLSESLLVTWGFAWRDFLGTFGGFAAFGIPVGLVLHYFGDTLPELVKLSLLGFILAWAFVIGTVWAMRGLLRAEVRRRAAVAG